MKKIFFYVAIIFLSIGCNSNKRDWEKAKKLNSITGYEDFVSKHPTGEFTQKAKIVIDSLELKEVLSAEDTVKISAYIKNHPDGAFMAKAKYWLDSLAWVKILSSQNIDLLELFLKGHTESKFLATSNYALDSIDWKIAYYSKDTTKLRQYSEKYPKNPNSEKATQLLWDIQWTPEKAARINVVFIWKDGFSDILEPAAEPEDEVNFTNGLQFDDFKITDNTVIYIWRNFTKKESPKIEKLGLKTGIAYLKTKNGYSFLKYVDLSKNNKEIRNEFRMKPNTKAIITGESFFGVSDEAFMQNKTFGVRNYVTN